MNYIIIDLEWNQAEYNSSVPGIPFEIIEIGAVKLNNKMEYIDSFHSVISPKLYRNIHHITHELTNITIDDLKSGTSFSNAAKCFLDWCGDDYMFCTWGMTDLTEFQRNLHYYRLPLLPFPVYYYDLQKIFSIIYEDGKTKRSLEYAVDYLNIPKKRDFHRALDDAFYTSGVMAHFDADIVTKNFSIDTYRLPFSKKNEIYAYYDTYSKYISRGFENKLLVMEDKSVTATPCYKCGKKLKKKIRWFSSNAKTYYSLCICPEHGYLKGKIRMKKHDNGLYYAIKTLKLTDDAGAANIYEKQADIRKKRRQKRQNAHLQ